MDNGVSWSAPASMASGTPYSSQLIALGKDGVWIVICDINYQIYLSRSVDYGVTWSTPEHIGSHLQLGTDGRGNWLAAVVKGGRKSRTMESVGPRQGSWGCALTIRTWKERSGGIRKPWGGFFGNLAVELAGV